MATLSKLDLKELCSDLLLSQFEESPSLQAVVESWAHLFQLLEDGVNDFVSNNGISNATGVMLEIIASWFDLEREGRTDAQLRAAILGRSLLEDADGTTEKVLSGLRALTGSSKVTFFELYPSTLYPVIGEGWTNGIVSEIQNIKAAGVACRVLLAKDLNYLTYGEVGEQGNLLHNEELANYQVEIGGINYDLAVSVAGSSSVFGATTTYGEAGIDIVSAAPCADVVLQDAKVSSGVLVDNNGNLIVDSEGNPITLIGYSYNG